MRVENERAREYYIREAEEQNWNTRTLERNINSFYYERLLTSKDKTEVEKHRSTLEKQSPEDFIKDPYVFEFLNIPQPIGASEKQIESALIENLQQFLLELLCKSVHKSSSRKCCRCSMILPSSSVSLY